MEKTVFFYVLKT